MMEEIRERSFIMPKFGTMQENRKVALPAVILCLAFGALILVYNIIIGGFMSSAAATGFLWILLYLTILWSNTKHRIILAVPIALLLVYGIYTLGRILLSVLIGGAQFTGSVYTVAGRVIYFLLLLLLLVGNLRGKSMAWDAAIAQTMITLASFVMLMLGSNMIGGILTLAGNISFLVLLINWPVLAKSILGKSPPEEIELAAESVETE